MDYDVLVVGGGIAGMQAASDLGDQGYKVLLVDDRDSIGGTMIQLSKVFPTLDCASCITTPKMSQTFHHPNIETRIRCKLIHLDANEDETFTARLYQRSTFVHNDKCTGCGECEDACPVYVVDTGYDEGLGIKKAIGVPFATALPQKSVLDPENCIFCGKCAKACPTEAIDYDLQDEEVTITAKSVVLATGFKETPVIKEQYGGGKFKNVITGKQMDRILAPTGPYGGVMRPSDGMVPWSIAYVQCAGSRDETIGVPYCSAVCCMFAIKQSILLSGAVPFADITIYYMDIRAFGKDHEQFYQMAKNMGINFVRGKVAKITEDENDNLTLRVERFDEDPGLHEYEHDLVVLSLGLVPAWDPEGKVPGLEKDQYGFIRRIRPKDAPSLTSIPGVFVAGTAAEPKDIVDSIVSASAAASKVSQWLNGELRDEYFIKTLI